MKHDNSDLPQLLKIRNSMEDVLFEIVNNLDEDKINETCFNPEAKILGLWIFLSVQPCGKYHAFCFILHSIVVTAICVLFIGRKQLLMLIVMKYEKKLFLRECFVFFTVNAHT